MTTLAGPGDDPGPASATSPSDHTLLVTAEPGVRWRAFTGLLVAMACVLTGHRMLLVAVPWLVLTRTGSPTQTGLVTAAQSAAYLITLILAGPLLDRAGARRTITVCALTSATALLALAVFPTAPIGVIAVLVAVVGAADGPSTAAKAICIPAISRTARQPLDRVIGVTVAVERAATTVGPALAGLLLTTLGGPRTLFAAALLFTLAAAAAALLPRPGLRVAGGGYLRELGDGARQVHADHTLRAQTVMYLLTNFIDEVLLVSLLPVWARDHGHGASGAAAALSIAGLTATVTALLAAGIVSRLPRRATCLAALIVGGVSRFVVLASTADLPSVLVVFALAGVGSGLGNPILLTVQYERTLDQLRGRTQTMINAVGRLGLPAGGLAGAALLTAGLPAALWICAAAYLAALLHSDRGSTWQPPPVGHDGQAPTTATPGGL
ncbi:MFS transporter [Actinoplanes sp. CA-131856]